MEREESFVVDEEQSPQSNQTWPMDMIKQRRFQHKMSSLLSPVTPKRNYSASNAKSLLLQCLRDSKSDPVPRKRFPVSCSDEGVLMDGVLVTSASAKKASGSHSRLNAVGRSPRSSLVRSQHKNSSSPRSLSGGNQEDTTRSQTSSGGKVKILANSPCTKLETPKAANPLNLKATAEPITLTPRSSQGLASPLPDRQLPLDHGPHIQWVNPPPHQQLPPSHGLLFLPPGYTYPRSLQAPDLYHPHYPFRSPRPIGYQMRHDLNQSPARNDPRIISLLPTTPLSTNTSKPPVHTPISTLPTANTTQDSRLDSSLSVDGGLETVTQKQDLSSPSDELVTMTQTRDSWSPAAELETSTHKPDFSHSAGTAMTEKDWSPSDDGLPQAQVDFMKSQDRVLPDDAFQHYIYRKRLPVFTQLCLDAQKGVMTLHTSLQTRPLRL